MNDFLDQLMEYPLSYRLVGWLIALLLMSYIFWQYFYKAQTEELTKVKEKMEQLNTQIAHERRLARNLSKFEKEVKDLNVKLKFALQELPDKREIPDLLASISDLAMDAGLEVSLFKPRSENMKEFYAEVPVSVSVEGTFHQVVTFFDEVGHLPRIVNINSIAIKEPDLKEQSVRIKADCVTTTFRYLEESERIKKKGGKGKRR